MTSKNRATKATLCAAPLACVARFYFAKSWRGLVFHATRRTGERRRRYFGWRPTTKRTGENSAMGDHDHTDPPSDPALRVKALESLLVEKGLIDPNVVGEFADYYEHRVGPRNGAKVVARAWVDPAYRERLLADG